MRAASPVEALKTLRDRLPAGGRIYAPGCSGEPSVFVDAMRAEPSLAADMTFLGVWIPGVNNVDYAGLHDRARAEAIFMAPPLRESFDRGALALKPLSYTQAYPWLETTPLNAALFQVTAPDAAGMVSLGVSADFSPAVWSRDDIVKVAHVNPGMPRPAATPAISLDTFDIVTEQKAPLLQYAPPPLSPVFEEIAKTIAALISDGDVLQFGLGNVQLAVLRALAGKQNLSIHSGMISDPVLSAVEAGAISNEPGAITTGVALGSDTLYAYCERDGRLRFAPVCETHSISTLSAIENFVAINSVIEVDLFGQANAEYIGPRQVSGAGGLVDFLRGAAASKGGKPILALASTAKNGAMSRIVPSLTAPSVSIGRADVGLVVTEHGFADLRGKSVSECAAAMISVADPRHREALTDAWRKIESAL